MEETQKRQRMGLIMVIVAGALWGTTGTLTKYVYAYGIDPLTLSLLRIGISFFALLAFAVFSGRKIRFKRQHTLFFLGFGAVSVAAFNIFYLTAIQLTTVTTAVVLLYTAPAFTLVAARFILKESFTTRKFLALLMTFAGIILVVEAYRPGQLALNIPGVLMGLGSGLTYGLYSIFSKAALRRGYTTLETVILALGAGFLTLSIVRPPWHLAPLLAQPFALWLLLVAIAVFSTMLAYVFFVTGLVHIDAGKATLVAAVEPVVAIIAAMLFLGETITLLQFVGIVAVLAAIRAQA